MTIHDQLPAVETIGVTRIFGTEEIVTALDDVSIRVDRGEFVAVQGSSGSGKSTLLHLLGGLDTPTSGRTLFAGTDLGTLDDDESSRFRRRRIGMVLPIVQLMPTMAVWENVSIASLLEGRKVSEGRARAEELLDSLKLSHRAQTSAARLSDGEAQRVSVARALYNDPQLLIADEPTSFLDSVQSDDLGRFLRRLADEGRTIVMATHDARAAAYADRTIRLLDGRVVDPRP